jgi:hypothetical protein
MSKCYTGKSESRFKLWLRYITIAAFCLTGSIAHAQYCVPEYFNGCSSNDDIDDFIIIGVGASSISDLNTNCGPNNGYEDRTADFVAVDLMQGGTYSGSVTTNFGNSEFYTIWIDFNDDFTFDASEDLTGLIGPFGSFNPSTYSITIPLTAQVGVHRMRIKLDFNAGGPLDPCATNVSFGETHDYLVNILPAPPCGGTPSITSVSPTGPVNTCAGSTQSLSMTIAIAGGYAFQWQSSANGGTSWSDIPNATNLNYTFSVTGNTDIRVYVICTNSGLADTSASVSFLATPPVYAPVPFFEDFETWQDYCADNDVPLALTGTNWTTQPATGDSSWRRDDEDFTAGYTTFGTFFPTFLSGAHSARFPTSLFAFSNNGSEGTMNLYLDCSGQTGGKQLYFYFMNPFDFANPPGDSLVVLMSNDGGFNFTQIGGWDTASTWKRRSLAIPSNSAQTIISFKAKVGSFAFDFTDIGLDSVYVAPPCTGAPAAGDISPAGPFVSCPGKSFVFEDLGGTMAGNINYQWQQSVNLGVTWTAVVGGNGNGTTIYTTPSLYDTTYYRMVATCLTSGLSDTTNVVVLNIAPPQYAAIPYVEDFENWVSFCDVNDAPSLFWINNPSTGDSSWRRDDEGSTAGWTSFGDFSPSFYSGAHSARFPSSNFFGSGEGTLDLLLNCSATTGDKQLYFHQLNQWDFNNADSLIVFLSTNAGANFTQIGGWDTAVSWRLRSLPIQSNSAQTIIRFRSKVTGFAFPGSDIGIDSVFVAPPCTGTPVAGTIVPGGTIESCPGNDFTLTNVGGSMAGNLQYDWEQSTDGGATWQPVSGGSGNGTFQYTTDALLDTTAFRLVVTCLGSGLEATTPVVTINVSPATYAALPYVQGFENWISFCDNQDVPDFSWINSDASGDMSWRRDDEGATANWNGPGFGGYNPVSIEGSHSARIHSSNGFSAVNPVNNFDLFVDCSDPGDKELQFFYINPEPFGIDQLDVSVSDNAGASFTPLTTLFGGTAQWTLQTLPFISTSPTTIIRFTATQDFFDDMGIDYVKVLLPCDGTPVAGTVDSLRPCSGQDFNLSLTGTSLSAGLAFQWQESLDGVNWTDIPGATNAINTYNITTPTYFRAIVTCTALGTTATSDERLLELATFYYCYCQSAAQTGDNDDIGNVTIDRSPSGVNILNNGVAVPLQSNSTAVNAYTNFTGITPTPLYKDSTYNFTATHIVNQNFYFGGSIAAWIDYNQDGAYDPFTEQVVAGSTTMPGQQVTGTFTVPGSTPIGLTGMRVIVVPFGFPTPCGAYFQGETEDYLVDINYSPCNGPVNPGTAYITDTLLCPGFPFTLTDTSYEKFFGNIQYIWQESTDGLSWTDVPGSFGEDTLTLNAGTVNTSYRFKVICTNSNSETFSNVHTVNVKAFFQCYCQSYADGGPADESDLGVFTIGNFVINTGGGHLNNPVAIEPYTDYTNGGFPIWLAVDSTYNVSFLHTIKSGNHQDAKVTMFMDFNNNHQYDIPDERVFTGFSSGVAPYINASVHIPATAVRNQVTGMRLIVNSDVNPNVPSDEACGTYVSGETEDYTIEFKNEWELSVAGVNNGNIDLQLFPNPTNGIFTVSCSLPKPAETIELMITDVNGRVIAVYNYRQQGKAFRTELNLGDTAAGMYFVTLKAGGEKIVRKLIVH